MHILTGYSLLENDEQTTPAPLIGARLLVEQKVTHLTLTRTQQNLSQIWKPETTIGGWLEQNVMVNQDTILVQQIVKHVVKPLFGVEMVRVAKDEVPLLLCSKDEIVLRGLDDIHPPIRKLLELRGRPPVPVQPVVNQGVLCRWAILGLCLTLLIVIERLHNLFGCKSTAKSELKHILGLVALDERRNQVTVTNIDLNRIHYIERMLPFYLHMLVDTFMFYNEFDVLQMRLENLDEYVDLFVLVEAEVNHVGGSKPLFYEQNKERYRKWWPKIAHVIVRADESPTDDDPWSREKYQRGCITRGLESVPNDSIVMVSDVDEIPDLRIVPYENLPHLVMSVHMWMFEYSFDYLYTGEPWFGTVITTAEYLKTHGANHLRDNRWKFPVIQYAGWHLSSFGDAEHISNKYKTYAHALDKGNHPRLTDPAMIDVWLKQGIHSDGKTSLVPRPPNVPLPP